LFFVCPDAAEAADAADAFGDAASVSAAGDVDVPDDPVVLDAPDVPVVPDVPDIPDGVFSSRFLADDGFCPPKAAGETPSDEFPTAETPTTLTGWPPDEAERCARASGENSAASEDRGSKVRPTSRRPDRLGAVSAASSAGTGFKARLRRLDLGAAAFRGALGVPLEAARDPVEVLSAPLVPLVPLEVVRAPVEVLSVPLEAAREPVEVLSAPLVSLVPLVPLEAAKTLSSPDGRSAGPAIPSAAESFGKGLAFSFSKT
jgi:hypothetical protein